MNKYKNNNVIRLCRYPIATFIAFLIAGCSEHNTPKPISGRVSFNESIRPILNKNCVGCHGGVTKQGGISYIYRDQAIARGNSGRLNIAPNNARGSELIQRIKSTDPARRMPYKRPALSAEEIALLERWIDEGAQWQEHWAFIPPSPVSPPELEDQSWASSPVDAFVLSKMRAQGLAPNRPAEPEAWLRRVSFDLSGLPPTETQRQAFLDTLRNPAPSADAYEEVVDHLLAAPAFGERWASVWLDIARYSDSRGYERDRHRDAWPYRDWLIDAFNHNMPYDDFVTKQLAGDLLPDATLGDHIATTFHRLTPANDEAGTDDEEYRIYAVMDRSATTWSAINGITMNCVQCHAHPYDPISHREYFHSLAFFNSTDDADRRADDPILKFGYSPSDNAALFEQQQQLEHNKTQLFDEVKQWQEEASWTSLAIASAYADEQRARYDIAEIEWLSVPQQQRHSLARCHSQTPSQSPPPADICEAIDTKVKTKYRRYLHARDERVSSTFASETPLQINSAALHDAKLGIPATANYQLVTEPHQGSRGQLGAITFTSAPLQPDVAIHSPQDGFTIERIRAEILRENGDREPLAIAFFAPSSVYGFEQMLALYGKRRETSPDITSEWYTGFAAHLLAHPVTTAAVLQTPAVLQQGDRLSVTLSQLQRDHSRGEKPYYLRHLKLAYTGALATGKARQLMHNSIALTQALKAIKTANVPVMREQIDEERRSTRVFHRGNFADKKGEDIKPLTPAVFNPGAAQQHSKRLTRLDLAHWFFDDQQPLTARVAVNRFWAQMFGRGIVSTLGDFGSIGASPSHPQLLDWLARYFQRDLDWDMKALLKTIALSATYRQSAELTEAARAKDPHNVFLARGPYQRLTAEMVRDQALAAAGLLSTKRGGVSVMPPQPAGVWQTVYNKDKWVDASGEDRFRRALYTYNKRTSPYPSFILFDDAGHLVSATQRFVTNTPLQALVTLNDIVYVEAAQALAKVLYQSARDHSVNEAINRGFLRVLARRASAEEIAVMTATLTKFSNPKDAEVPLEAWTNIASILLNLDASLKR